MEWIMAHVFYHSILTEFETKTIIECQENFWDDGPRSDGTHQKIRAEGKGSSIAFWKIQVEIQVSDLLNFRSYDNCYIQSLFKFQTKR